MTLRVGIVIPSYGMAMSLYKMFRNHIYTTCVDMLLDTIAPDIDMDSLVLLLNKKNAVQYDPTATGLLADYDDKYIYYHKVDTPDVNPEDALPISITSHYVLYSLLESVMTAELKCEKWERELVHWLECKILDIDLRAYGPIDRLLYSRTVVFPSNANPDILWTCTKLLDLEYGGSVLRFDNFDQISQGLAFYLKEEYPNGSIVLVNDTDLLYQDENGVLYYPRVYIQDIQVKPFDFKGCALQEEVKQLRKKTFLTYPCGLLGQLQCAPLEIPVH